MRHALLPLSLVPALLAGCASQGPFPSLAPRAIEQELGDARVATGRCRDAQAAADGCFDPAQTASAQPAAITPDDPQLRSRVAELLGSARRGQSDFTALLPRASQQAARAGSSGSESWVAAQQEVSRLEAARSATVDSLAALDGLVIARSRQPTSAGDYEALLAAAEEARRLADTQQAEIDRIGTLLSPA